MPRSDRGKVSALWNRFHAAVKLFAQEAVMRETIAPKCILWVGMVAGAFLVQPGRAYAQNAEPPATQKVDLAGVSALVQQLQAQVQELNLSLIHI